MYVRLAFSLFPLLLLGAPVYKAAQKELKQCLDNAISEEDKISCDQSQHAKATVCGDDERKTERNENGETMRVEKERW